jgi:putative MATE family efflux protein
VQVQATYKDIWKMSYPVMVGSIAITVLNVTDTAFLGRVGETELAASAIGGIFYLVLVMIGVAIGIGTQILVARRAGERRHADIGDIVDHSALIFAVLGALLLLILEVAAPALIPRLLSDTETARATVVFLTYRSWGIVAILLGTVFRSFYVGIAQPRVFGYYSFLLAAVNILLAYALVFGHWGLPAMGIAGAGLASTLAEYISLAFIVLYTRFKPDIREYRLFRFRNLRAAMIRQNLDLSAPLVLQNILSMGAWFIFFVFIEKIGTHDLAVSNIVRGVYMINMTPIWGFMVAANSMVSNIIGQGRKQDVMTLLHRVLVLSLAVTAATIVINVLFPYRLLGIFTTDPVYLRDGARLLHVINVAMVFFASAIVSISALSGTGATRTALLIEVAAIAIYIVYIFLAVFTFRLDAAFAWMSEIIYWLVTGAASYAYLRSRRWERIVV